MNRMEKLDISSLLSAPRDITRVPVLDEESFHLGKYRDGSVLKFRGVVCDVQDPELVQLSDDQSVFETQDLIERLPLVVTISPHMSGWAKQKFSKKPVINQNDGRCIKNVGPSTSKGTKRFSAAVDEQMDEISGQEQNQMQVKKSKAVETPNQEDARIIPRTVNIYVYDGQYKDMPLDAFKVNEAFEFVGILDLMVAGTVKKDAAESVLNVKQLEELAIADCLEEMQCKGRSGVVLHCSHVNILEGVHHVRPHESSEFYEQIHVSNDSRTTFCQNEWMKLGQTADVAVIRKQLVDFLTQAVGDKLAAEYLLLSLVSHVYSRADSSTPLGSLSLNLSLDKSLTEEQKRGFVARIQQMLMSLMPMVARVDLSLEELNSTKFMPHKDYEREILLGGVLQTANGTTMLVNETTLTAGKLNDQGVKNIAALQSLIDKMLLPYDFHYYNIDFPQDVAIVTVSEGKSILPVTVAVRIVSTAGTIAEMQPLLLPEEQVLECFRVFVSVLRSFVVTIGNEEAEIAEKHYVECRKSQQKVALEDLHRWLRLARLVALSRGEGHISKDSWNAMLVLEIERLARLPNENAK